MVNYKFGDEYTTLHQRQLCYSAAQTQFVLAWQELMAVTQKICEKWDTLPDKDKREELTKTINDTLVELGYEPVHVEFDDLSGIERGSYNYQTKTITLDEQHVYGNRLGEVLDTAYHEAGHAIEQQDGYWDAMTPEEQADYADETPAYDYIDPEDPRLTGHLHDEVNLFAEYEVELAKKQCGPSSSESAWEPDSFDFEFEDLDSEDVPQEPDGAEEIIIEMGEPIIRDEPRDNSEWFTIGEPIITSGGDNNSSTNLETPPRPGAAGSGP